MDLNKYKYYKFHRNYAIDFQIKALLLKFDFEVKNLSLNEEDQIILIDVWIKKFNNLEFYEYLKPFKQRKSLLQSNVIFNSEINIDGVESKLYKMTLKEKVKAFIKGFLKNRK